MQPRIGDWMVTASGRAYFPIDPSGAEIDAHDIAQSLSRICRYLGHCTRWYSVAEHSVLVSLVVPEYAALHGLLHDAQEAYVCDIHRPLKSGLLDYIDIESRNEAAVTSRFGFEEYEDIVKRADDGVLMAEKNAIVPRSDRPWTMAAAPAEVPIIGWWHPISRLLFLQRLHELTAGAHGRRSAIGWATLALTKLIVRYRRGY